MQAVQEIRNSNKHLVGKYNPTTATLEILGKGCLTVIHFLSNGEIEVMNSKTEK